MANISKVELNGTTYNVNDSGSIPASEKGAANGVASLDSTGKVPSSQLPSYVDDVLEYSAKSSFPASGESGKIYVDTSTNKTYRWSGSAYVEISASLALGETSSTAYRGDRGKAAYDHSQTTSGNPHNVTKSDVGLGNVGNFKAVSTVASQGLSNTEKSNARANIGAGTSSLTIGTTATTAAAGNHTHPLTLAADSGTVALTLAHNTGYKLTAGGSSFIFKTPADNNTYPSAYCSTAAGTAAKVATCTGYALLAKSYIQVLITTANTSASALTLNINGKGAKPIYINGSASSSSNYTLPAGSYLVYYNGTNYYFRTDGKITTASNVAAFTDGSNWSVNSLLCTYAVMLSNGSAGTIKTSQSYACKSNHIVSLHACISTTMEIAVGSETAIGYSSSSPYGDNYNFYPLTLAFYSGTPIAGVQCYMRGGYNYIYVKPLQAAIPNGTMLYINGTYLTEDSYPNLPTLS